MTDSTTEGPTLEEAQAQRDAAVRELEEFKTRTARMIIREATEHGMDRNIDRWLEEVGVPRPMVKYTITWQRTITETSEIEATTRSDAERRAYDGQGRPGDGWMVSRVRESA